MLNVIPNLSQVDNISLIARCKCLPLWHFFFSDITWPAKFISWMATVTWMKNTKYEQKTQLDREFFISLPPTRTATKPSYHTLKNGCCWLSLWWVKNQAKEKIPLPPVAPLSRAFPHSSWLLYSNGFWHPGTSLSQRHNPFLMLQPAWRPSHCMPRRSTPEPDPRYSCGCLSAFVKWTITRMLFSKSNVLVLKCLLLSKSTLKIKSFTHYFILLPHAQE